MISSTVLVGGCEACLFKRTHLIIMFASHTRDQGCLAKGVQELAVKVVLTLSGSESAYCCA